MTAWETEDEYAAAGHAALPSPTDTPRSNRTRNSQNRISNVPVPSPSCKRFRRHSRSNDLSISEGSSYPIKNEESNLTTYSISMLDPRRFTPTLHASLVSEILGLRRDQEEKKKLIETLESTLLESREEQESFAAGLSTTAQENYSLKRKLNLLEGDTTSALSELIKERDIALESATEVKGRLLAAKKKIRNQEEGIDRTNELWARDKADWEEQKRKMERRIHVAENRLKNVLEEVAAYETRHNVTFVENNGELEVGPSQNHSLKAEYMQRKSMTNSIRFSLPPNLATPIVTEGLGLSLAEELEFNLEDDANDCVDWESVASLPSPSQSRPCSRSSLEDKHHSPSSKRATPRPLSIARERVLLKRVENPETEVAQPESVKPESVKSEYIDSGIQFSPLLSSKFESPYIDLLPPSIMSLDDEQSAPAPSPNLFCVDKAENLCVDQSPITHHTQTMISVAIQTNPETPNPTTVLSASQVEDGRVEMKTGSTQTDLPLPKSTPTPIMIPYIQLYPPSSTPATPRERLLPQQFKDAGCQAYIAVSAPLRSISVQTEEIRIDKRLNCLPRHLQPSAISSNPPSPSPEIRKLVSLSNVSGHDTPGSVMSDPLKSCPDLPDQDYDGNSEKINEKWPKKAKVSFGKSPVIGNYTANSENSSSDDEFADADLTDAEYRTPLYTPKHRKAQSSQQNLEHHDISASSGSKLASSQASIDRENNGRDFSKSSGNSGTGSSMKSISNGLPNTNMLGKIYKSQLDNQLGASRPSSPSERLPEPPFPIPLRRSSRRVEDGLFVFSDRTDSLNHGRVRRGHRRSGSVRRIRPIAAISRPSKPDCQSLPPKSISIKEQQSPTLSPMSANESPRRMNQHVQHGSYTPTSEPASTPKTLGGGSDPATSIVGAIAQTMVGEWMFKYVRRRKSIGVTESNLDTETSNGVRHKRWVWLAPYERVVMWSSKQPTSGSALMGKSGRKLLVQSVLDVKDDNPPLKGVQLFNRSILILTPARALKFTATTMERHYKWLTALSFLAHSSQAIPEALSPSIGHCESKPHSFFEASPPSRHRQVGIRQDSIRLAKSKLAVASQAGLVSAQSTSELPTESFYSLQNTSEAAYAPIVPRFTDRSVSQYPSTNITSSFTPYNQRKRSDTGSRKLPLLSVHGFDSPMGLVSPSLIKNHSPLGTSSPTDTLPQRGTAYCYSPSSPRFPQITLSNTVSVDHDELSRSKSNFFDGVGAGTVRMEAFIAPASDMLEGLGNEIHDVWAQNENLHESTENLHEMDGTHYKESKPNSYFSGCRGAADSRSVCTKGTMDYSLKGSLRGSIEENWDAFRGF